MAGDDFKIHNVKAVDFNFEPGFVPPKNLQYFLLILREIKKVDGRIKLFKIHSLIEEEGRVEYNRPIDTYSLGPVDYETFNFCKENGLIEDTLIKSFPYDYYQTYLTERGKAFFEKFCRPNMKESDINKAIRIIQIYKNMRGIQILTHIHKKYVDPFKDAERVQNFIDEALARINLVFNLVKNYGVEDIDNQRIFLGEIRHLSEILKSLKGIDDPTKIGTILVNLDYFFECARINNYKRNPLSIELFEFLNHYADKENIQKSISSSDFSDIDPQEKERLFQAIIEIKIPPHQDKKGDHAIETSR